jgi:tetratricopeptide (TPR) repeat protein
MSVTFYHDSTRLRPDLSKITILTLVILASLSAVETRAETSLETPTAGALASSPLSDSSPEEESKHGTTNEGTLKSPGSAATVRVRAKLARVHFENGMKYRREGDSGRALVDFLKATREDPKLVEAYYEQALIFREKGFHKLAVSRLEQAIAIRGQFQKARLLLATIKLEQGNVSDAVEQLGASLGLPKTETTALKPEAKQDDEDKDIGLPPMILQSVHNAMPLPKGHRAQADRNKISQATDDNDESTSIVQSPKASPAKQIRRKKPGTRRKVRELMARKYRKNNVAKKSQRMNWIAKIFSWPEPFKAPPAKEKIAADESIDDDELMPSSPTSTKPSNLIAEFQSDDKKPDTAIEEDDSGVDFTPHFPKTKKTLLAYNGDPKDTIDLVSDKNSEKTAVEKTNSVNPSPGWSSATSAERESAISEPVQSHSSNRTLEKTAARKISFSEPAPTKNSTVAKLDSTKHTRATVSKASDKSDDSESSGKPFELSARQIKIASKGWLDFDAGTPRENPAKKTVERKPIVERQPEVVEDEWTRRLRYLAEHGTSSLRAGEAFMFSEDTGEAVLFTNHGQRIRRIIAASQETQEVLKLRRPDVLVPKELFYNTALLGKVVASPPPPMPPQPVRLPDANQPSSTPQPNSSLLDPPGFKIEQMMDNPTGFWNWFKGLVNL